MTTPVRDAPATFNLSADGLAIDFANTADWHAAAEPVELLTSYERLVSWGQAAGLLDAPGAEALLATARQRPVEAESTLAGALALREAIYHIFSAVARGERAPATDLATLNAALPGALARLRLSESAEDIAYAWTGQEDERDLCWFLAPVVRAAAELLVSSDTPRLRECAGHPCGWIFLDHSRNRTRRWCSMAGCGNRAKAKRHYERAKRVTSDQ